MKKRHWILICGLLIAGLIVVLMWPRLRQALFYLTGEEAPLPQISGTALYLLTLLQPPLQTADMVPVQYTGHVPLRR